MIGPRNSVIKELLGEYVPLEEMLMDQSEFIDSDEFRWLPWYERPPEFWADLVHDFCAEELDD